MNKTFKTSMIVLTGMIFLFGGIVPALAQESLPEPVPVVTPAEYASSTAAATALSAAADPFPNLKCGISLTGSNLMGCFPLAAYYVVYKPVSWFLIFVLYLFNAVLTLSISNKFIDQPFVNDLWTLLRNFSNMIFIFILIYTGVRTMLGREWRKTVINVVIIALLINFSLFFTKVVIDAGNVLAVGVYSSMAAPSTDGPQANPGDVQERGVATAIASNFEPQKFLGEAGAKALNSPMDAMIIFLVAIVVNGAVAYIFFKAMLLFLGRILAFWYVMVISPFAFTSIVLPKGSIFSSWSDTLINQAFVAPVFLFLIYMIMRVITAGNGILSNVLTPSGGTGFLFNELFVPIIMAALIYIALSKALGVAEKMSGSFGSAVSKIVGQAVGVVGTVAVGAATGGAAMALRGTVGQAAAGAMAESGSLSNMANSERSGVAGRAQRFLGRSLLNSAETVSNATFDARNVGAVALAGKAFDMDLKGGKVGYVKERAAWMKADIARADKLEIPKDSFASAQDKTEMELAKKEATETQKMEQDLGTLVELSKKAADTTPQGIARATAAEAEKNAKEALDKSRKDEDAAITELDTAKKLRDPARETAARFNIATASAAVQANNSAHIAARNTNLAASRDYEATPEAQAAKDNAAKLLEAKKARAAAEEKSAEVTKRTDKNREDENMRRREQFAQDTALTRTPISAIGAMAGRNAPKNDARVGKIRDAGKVDAKKERGRKKNLDEVLKDLAKLTAPESK